jgi:hypothetical protein
MSQGSHFMNEEFYRRQAEQNQDQERQRVASQKHSTLETYNLEQQEAHTGHIPDPKGADVVPPAPTLWQRIKKLLGL